MNKDILGGMWKQLKGEVRRKWGKLTDDDVEEIAGQRDKFVGKLQEKYGYTREDAEMQLDRFISESNRGSSSGRV